MAYFDRFPQIAYNYKDNDVAVVTDIMSRFVIRETVLNNADLFISYQVRDGERFEDIATRVYKDASYAWVLFLANRVIDPYWDIPVSQNQLEERVAETYPGWSVFMDPNEFNGNFEVGENVSNGSQTRTVIRWDATFRELTVDSPFLELGSVITGLTTGAIGTPKRQTERQYAVHHFEDVNGIQISPLFPDTTLMTSYVTQTELGSQTAITNFDFEERENDRKRLIKVLRPEYAKKVVDELETVFEER
jgi:hypothetical protein